MPKRATVGPGAAHIKGGSTTADYCDHAGNCARLWSRVRASAVGHAEHSRRRSRGDAATAGEHRRDDGAPEVVATDRRRQRRQPGYRHARLSGTVRRHRELGLRHRSFSSSRSRISDFHRPIPYTVTIGDVNFAAKPLEYTIGTPPDGVTGPLVAARVEDTPGCTAGDYDALPVTGAIVLVDRGDCPLL